MTNPAAPAAVAEPSRETPLRHETDVLVVGGGSAGVAAAVAAARAGARVMLVERTGGLGGLASGGLILLLLTLDDGRGRQVVGGICQEVVDRLAARGAAYFPSASDWGRTDPEGVGIRPNPAASFESGTRGSGVAQGLSLPARTPGRARPA